jgi:tight adherence protein C
MQPPPAAAHLPDARQPAPREAVAAPGRGGRRGLVIALSATAVVATVGVSLLVGQGPGLLVGACGGGVVLIRRAARRRAASRLRAERASAAPAVIDLLGACLLAGLNPYRSLLRIAERSPGALRAELVRAAAELDLGRTPAAALRAVGERTSLDELRAAAAALEAAERWGAPPAEALAARAEALRSRARLRAEAEAGRAAVRLAFPLVFCFLPAFVLLVVVPTLAGALRVLAP